MAYVAPWNQYRTRLHNHGSSFTPLLTGKDIIGGIDDKALRIVLREAHTERWGIFVGLWPVTLVVLSYIIGKKAK